MKNNKIWPYLFAALIYLVSLSNLAYAEEKSTGKRAVAIFAGGCFWCMEGPFDILPGVIKTVSGYTGGTLENPTYKEVSNGKTGHSEAIEITYDPAQVTYEKLLDVFWHNIDPFDNEGQFCDKGDQYKAIIFYVGDTQKILAETSKIAVKSKFGDKTVVTEIKPAGKFFPAEDYHQDYYLNNPNKYKFYRFTCGRDRRLDQVWSN